MLLFKNGVCFCILFNGGLHLKEIYLWGSCSCEIGKIGKQLWLKSLTCNVVWYMLFILNLQGLLDYLLNKGLVFCVRWSDILLAGTATLLAVWHVTGIWSEWVRLSRLGPSPARSYRMCMLDVCSQGKTQQTHSFTTSQNITGTLPSHHRTARASTSPN